MPRKSRKLKGGLSQDRQAKIQNLQDLQNNKQDLSLTFGEVKKTYLIPDLLASIQLLSSKVEALDNQDDRVLWNDYVKHEIEALKYMSSGKSIKGITGAIAAYNIFKRTADKFDRTLLSRQKTAYECGTVTCKERGQKIKEALTVLASFSPDALGQFGGFDAVASASNWFGNSTRKLVGYESKVDGTDPTKYANYANFLGLPPNVVDDLVNGDKESTQATNQPTQVNNQPTQATNQPTQATNQQPTQVNNQQVVPAKKTGWFWGGKRTRRR